MTEAETPFTAEAMALSLTYNSIPFYLISDVNGKSRLGDGLFSKYTVNVKVILNFSTDMCISLKPIPKENSLRR